MKHHVRTTFGDSKLTVDSEDDLIPYQGVLQGNGAPPATWVIISSPLLEMLRKADNGGHFISPISKKESHIAVFAYVDDTDLIQLDMRNTDNNSEDSLIKMQEAINRWEGGLKTTGGAIVPTKSWVYPIGFSFDNNGKWKYKSTEEIDLFLLLKMNMKK